MYIDNSIIIGTYLNSSSSMGMGLGGGQGAARAGSTSGEDAADVSVSIITGPLRVACCILLCISLKQAYAKI